MAVVITRTEKTAQDLRASASKANDAKAVRRMLAIALVLEGVGRKTAAETCGMDRQTLRDWVHRYNDEGLGHTEFYSDQHSPFRAPAAPKIRSRSSGDL